MQPTSLRDVRLDFFRGLAMFIIFVAHMPGNSWANFLPRAIGPSDAAEWFVFCSGFASALAFGKVFEQRGLWLGTSRILHRVWQLYWCQIAVFLLVAALCVAGTRWLDTYDYVARLNLTPFFAQTEQGLLHLLTLTYVPPLLDILPMYMVLLLFIPPVMALRAVRPWLALAFPPALYLTARALDWNLPAEWWSERSWFFNPFTWQLLFFTGFALGRGWIHPPPFTAPWLALAAAIMVVLFPLNFDPIWQNVAWIGAISDAHVWTIEKTDFGPARYAHVLAMAFLGLALLDRFPEFLRWRGFEPVVKVGQQTLPVFLSTLVLSWSAGMFLDVVERTPAHVALANLAGFALMLAVAHITGFYKSQPWRRPRHKLDQGAGEPGRPPAPAPALGAD
jgi:hypothetical protein